ncbi:MAG: anti-sigma factor family protein [Anaerolineae bacterium]
MTKHVTGLLDRYHDGELSARERIRVEEHLDTCDECCAALEELEQLSVVLHESPPAPTLTPPDRFVAQVRLRLPRRQPLVERRWVKVGGVAFPVALVGAWIFVQVIWLFIAVALALVELGWGVRLGLQPTGTFELFQLISGGGRSGLDLVWALLQLEDLVRWLVLLPLQMMVTIAALYGLWLMGLRRWRMART